MRGVKFFGVLAIACAFTGCMTLENRRDLYTADFDRWPVSRSATSSVQTTSAPTAITPPPIRTRKTPPEVKPIPNEPEETPNLPEPLPPPPP